MNTRIPFVTDLKSELLDHAPEGPFESTRRRNAGIRRGPVVAVAAFLVVLVAGGVVVWSVTRADGPGAAAGPYVIDWDIRVAFVAPDDPTAFIAEIGGLPGVSEVQYFPDASVPFPPPPLPARADDGLSPPITTADGSTVPPEEFARMQSMIATLLLRLDEAGRAEDVALALGLIERAWTVIYSEAVAARLADDYFAWVGEGATIVHRRPLVLQPAPGPEPRFDPSGLGREITLQPATVGEGAGEWLSQGYAIWEHPIPQQAESALPSPERDDRRPVLHLGWDAGRDWRLAVFPARGFPVSGYGYCQVVLLSGGAGASCGDFANAQFGLIMGGSDGYLTVRVPADTSVVAFSGAGAEGMWQRPVAGWAMFPVRWSEWSTFPGAIEAYDIDGVLLGRWGAGS